MTEQNQNKKALWIFTNIKESVDILPKKLRGQAWEMIINYAFGDENVEQSCKNLKVLLTFRVVKPLLRLRGITGSQGEKSNNPSSLVKQGEMERLDSRWVLLTPIEKIMYEILLRVKNIFNESYGRGVEMYFDCQRQIGKYRVDFFVWTSFSKDKIIIECDGHDFHEKTKEQAKYDKERDRWLTSQGYKILKYTGSEIYNDFYGVEDELKKLLDIKVGNTRALFDIEGEKQ